MYVGQAIELAREWVETEGSQTPGFCGAHLMGSLNRMPKDAPLPTFSDVDFNILSREVKHRETRDLPYGGLLLEYGIWPIEDYESPETILANPELASNLAVQSILADPMGVLGDLQHVVAQDYCRRRWVQARCQWEKTRVLQSLDALSQSQSPIDVVLHLNWAAIHLAGLVAITQLKPPTHRRCLVLMYDLLCTRNRLNSLEQTLCMLGYADLAKAEVESVLREIAAAFDKAIEVKRTPSPYDFKLHPHVRPYFIQGSQQIIDEGHHREAMIWIMACYLISLLAILNDATDEDKQNFLQAFERVLRRCGLSTHESWQTHTQQARILADEVFAIADSWVSENAQIVD